MPGRSKVINIAKYREDRQLREQQKCTLTRQKRMRELMEELIAMKRKGGKSHAGS